MPELLASIDEQVVKEVLSQELPGLATHSIVFHHAYEDRCVAEVNDALILKFPLREDAQKQMERERWVLAALQGQTSLAVPAPMFSAHQVFCYAYKKIPGVLLTDEYYQTLTSQQRQDLVVALARFLVEMHTRLDVSKAIAAGLQPPDDPLSAQLLRQRLLPLLQESRQVLFVEKMIDRYEQIAQTEKESVVLHGDLHGWNVALDPASDQLVGVFDFNGTCIGDPHLDFRYFFYTDPALLESVIAHYQHMSARKLSLTRCILYAAATDLSDIVYSLEDQKPLYEGPLSARLTRLERQLRNYNVL